MDEENLNINSYPVELNSMYFGMSFLDEALLTGVSLEQLKLYVKYPMRYNQQIRRLSREMYSLNGVYAKTVDYMVSCASLDFITIPRVNKKVNQKKRQLFNQLIKKANHKLTTRDILLSLFLDGIYVGLLRNTKPQNKNTELQPGAVDNLQVLEGLAYEGSLMVQPLYIDYVKIIGFQNNDYIVAFDMQYFDQFIGNGLTGEIKNFPPEFAKAYLLYKKDGNKRYFRLDQDKTVVLKFKSNINEPWGRPLGICALNDMSFDEQYVDSQRSNVTDVASNVFWMKQPMGEKQGQCALNKDQQTNQYDNFKNAIFASTRDKKLVKTTTMVLAPGTEVGKLDKNSSLLDKTLTDENMKKISTDLGFATSALNGDGGANYSTLQVNIDLMLTQVWQLLEQISYQYTKVFNSLISFAGKDIIEMAYLKTSTLTKDKDINNAKELYTLGGGSRLYWIATTGVEIDLYMSLMEYEKEEKFDEKYPPHQTAYTVSGKDGRPTENNPKNENTLRSKTNGNNQPRPSNG